MATKRPTRKLEERDVVREIKKSLLGKFSFFYMIHEPTSVRTLKLSKIEMEMIHEALVLYFKDEDLEKEEGDD